MGYLNTYNNKPPTETFGQKVQNVSQTLGAIKGMHDVGKTIYSGIQTAAPIIRMGMALL